MLQKSVKLNNGTEILARTIIWSGGVSPTSLVSSLTCEHDVKSGRIVIDKYLQLPEYKGFMYLETALLLRIPIQVLHIHPQHNMP